jgi:hypothetical protein
MSLAAPVPAALCRVRPGDEKLQSAVDTDGWGTAVDAQVVRIDALNAQVSAGSATSVKVIRAR